MKFEEPAIIVKHKEKIIYGLLVLVVLCVCLNASLFLSSSPIQDWDEARQGVNAYEMLKNGDYLVHTYNGAPDYWNLKPPLSFYPVASGYKLFGFNPLGLRFFSAFFAVATVVCLLFFSIKFFSTSVALLATAILGTVWQYWQHHHARTGDPDALFIFFYIAGLLLVLGKTTRPAHYYIASFLTGLAFLTKSFHAAPMALTIMIFFIMDQSVWLKQARNKIIRVGKQGALAILCFLLPVLVWGFLRYKADGTAFLHKMFMYDLVERASSTIEGHVGGPFYYLNMLFNDFQQWLFAIISVSIILMTMLWRTRHNLAADVISPKEMNKNEFTALTIKKLVLAVLIPVLLFSSAKSKLPWYTYQAYPFIALLLAIFAVHCLRKICSFKRGISWAILILFVFMFCRSEIRQLNHIYKQSLRVNPIQQKLHQLGNIPENRGAKVFLVQGVWTPSQVLVGKLYGDFILLDGGKQAYEQDAATEKAFLIELAP